MLIYAVSFPLQVIKCLHVTEVYQFHAMIDMLVKCGYKKGTTLFGYGYDFRQSNRYVVLSSKDYAFFDFVVQVPFLVI